MGGERASDSDDEEPFSDDREPFTDDGKPNSTRNTDGEPNSARKTDERSYTHTNQPEFYKELLRAVEPNRSLMRGTDSRSGAVISREPSANEPGATKELKAMNSTGNAERMDPERDLQITSSSNEQSTNLKNRSSLRPRRTLRPTFKVQENQLITEIL